MDPESDLGVETKAVRNRVVMNYTKIQGKPQPSEKSSTKNIRIEETEEEEIQKLYQDTQVKFKNEDQNLVDEIQVTELKQGADLPQLILKTSAVTGKNDHHDDVC